MQRQFICPMLLPPLRLWLPAAYPAVKDRAVINACSRGGGATSQAVLSLPSEHWESHKCHFLALTDRSPKSFLLTSLPPLLLPPLHPSTMGTGFLISSCSFFSQGGKSAVTSQGAMEWKLGMQTLPSVPRICFLLELRLQGSVS